MSWETFFLVGVGGFFGANLRYLLTLFITESLANATGITLPFGTGFVNLTGSMLLAMFTFWVSQRTGFLSDSLKLLVGTGFFGAYTTFSTYANESVNLFYMGSWGSSFAYVLLTNALCLLGVIVGLWLANLLWSV